MSQPVTVFISYAHEDELLREQLVNHLRPLQWQGVISTWHDREILAGSNWAQEIDEQMNCASIILLLISPDFFASDYCYGIEMRRALERHQRKEAKVVPVLLRPSSWEGTPLSYLQALPEKGRPVVLRENKDSAFVSIVAGMKRVIEDPMGTFQGSSMMNIPHGNVQIPQWRQLRSLLGFTYGSFIFTGMREARACSAMIRFVTIK